MMPDLQMSVMCDDVRQENNGKFMLIGLFDVVGLSSFPGLFQRICIVNRWCSGEGPFKERTRLMAPDGSTVVVDGREVAMTLANSEANATSVEWFLNVKFNASSVYWVEVLLNGDLRLRYPLRVAAVTPRPEPPQVA